MYLLPVTITFVSATNFLFKGNKALSQLITFYCCHVTRGRDLFRVFIGK